MAIWDDIGGGLSDVGRGIGSAATSYWDFQSGIASKGAGIVNNIYDFFGGVTKTASDLSNNLILYGLIALGVIFIVPALISK